MDRGLRARGAHLPHAAAGGDGSLRPHTLVRGARESQEQPRYRDLRRGRTRHRHLLRAEPLLCAVCRALPAGLIAHTHPRRLSRTARCGGAHRNRGCAFPQPLGYRYPVALPRGYQDCHAAAPLAGRRQHHNPAAGKEPLPARHGKQPQQGGPYVQARAVEVQGVDHGPQARTQLYQGGDRRHVSQHGGIRLERLRHQVRRQHLLRQGARRAEHTGGGRTRGRGERPHALLSRTQL